MKRIRQGWNTLRRNKRSGVSLIVALCAVAVLIGLSLSIVYSSSMLLSRANRKIGRERCYQLAKSFSEVLTNELEAYNTDRSDLGGTDDKTASAANQPFYLYANHVLEKFPVYDTDKPDETTYYYTTGNADDEYGKVTVSLRSIDTKADDPTERNGEFSYNDRRAQTTAIAAETFLHYQLMVRVTIELGADSYTYITQYNREDGYEPIYTWKGSDSGEFRVYWVNGEFCKSANGSEPVSPSRSTDEDGSEHEEIVTIAYRYDSDKMTYKKYSPMYGPDGGAADE